MKTVTVLGYNRPEYLRRTLTAVAACRGLNDYTLLVSVDDGRNQWKTLRVAEEFCKNLSSRCELISQDPARGVDWHNSAVYDFAFKELGSAFNLALEDDTPPAPDALELADWFYAFPNRDNYACLLLHSHSLGQWDPLDLEEVFRFNAWGWAQTAETWEKVFKPQWNCKKYEPFGWDWSAEYALQKQGLKSLKAHLSRTINIGREQGVHEWPENWDSWAKDLEMSTGAYGNEYRIVSTLPLDYAEHLSDWVLAEDKGPVKDA